MNLHLLRRVAGAICLAMCLAGAGLTTPAAAAPPATFEELAQDPSLHRGHSEVLRLYYAVLDRVPEVDGALFWLNAYDSGEWTTRDIAAFFAASPEFVAVYGPNVPNADFVRIVYENVLDRPADDEGFNFWLDQVDGGMSRAEMVLLVSNAPEFINRIPLPSDTRTSTGPVVRTTPAVVAYFDGVSSLNGGPNPSLAAPGSPAEAYANYIAAVIQFVDEDLGLDFFVPTSRDIGNTSIVYQPTGRIYDNIRVESGKVADFTIDGVALGPSIVERTEPVVVGDVTVARVIGVQSEGAIGMVFYLVNNGTSSVTVSADLARWTVGGNTFTPFLGTDPIHTLEPGQGRSFVSVIEVADTGNVFQAGTVFLPMADGSGSLDATIAVGP